MKLKLVKYEQSTESSFHRVKIFLHEPRARSDSDVCREHDHTLDHTDSIKINTTVITAAADEVAWGYQVCTIKNNLKSTKHNRST